MQTRKFGEFDGAAFFGRKLRDAGRPVTRVSDPSAHRERIREAIVACGLQHVVIGHTADGKPETYQQAFERFFGIPLNRVQSKEATT